MICVRKLFSFLNKDIEIKWGWNFTYKISQYHDKYTLYFSLIFVTFYIPLPHLGYDYDNWDRAWGVYWYNSAIWFQWDKHTKGFDMPWSWFNVRSQVMYPDGLKNPPGESWNKEDGRIIEVYPYTYKKKDGEVQERMATVYIEEREWRWKGFTWLPWPNLIRRTISVNFDGEVGEKSGSWKGGCVGCGYDMLPGEKILDTLRRMEKERKF